MKKQILLLFFASATLSMSAQLKVDNLGRVKIPNQLEIGIDSAFQTNSSVTVYRYNDNSTEPAYGIFSKVRAGNSAIAGNCLAVSGIAEAKGGYPTQVGMVGVLGQAVKSTNMSSKFGAGIVGLGSTFNGVGVYGGIGTSLPASWSAGACAGYFAGAVKVTGTVTAAVFSTSSDYRLKQDIKPISEQSIPSVVKLNPVSYMLKADSVHFNYEKESQEVSMPHFGLIAQEVREIYPNLVYEAADGYLSVNYTELIPLLIHDMKQLHEELISLKAMIGGESSPKRVNARGDEVSVEQSALMQNTPNPSNNTTVIAYSLPESTTSASIRIYDLNGRELNVYPLSEFGRTELSVDLERFESGMYIYSLIADGQIVDTKRMIVSK